MQEIVLIGFGEAGGILGGDLATVGSSVRCYDILLHDQSAAVAMQNKALQLNVGPCSDLCAALTNAELIISAVTANAAHAVARACADYLQPGQYFLDINSVAPDTKRANARLIEARGAHYVEAAVMAPVPLQRIQTPMLLGGARSAELAATLGTLGMQTTVVSDEIGVASAIKMCRSIMIKGIEALTVECLWAARQFGAEQQVLTSLDKTFPHMGWLAMQPDYLISRVAEHGQRRAAEMREVAKTLESIQMTPVMATATANRQQWLTDQMAKLNISYQSLEPFSWRQLVDRLTKP